MKDEFISDEFFVVRTPLLPRDAFAQWSGELEAQRLSAAPLADLQAALGRDRQSLRERLEAIVRDPVIREALIVASRDLQTGLQTWQDSPDSKKGRNAERSLVRYFTRMSTRCTPFGLFAGVSTGRIGDSTRVELRARDRYQRHTRLDLAFVEAIARRFQDKPALRRRIHVRANPTLYRCADRWRYVEASTSSGRRSHHLVSLMSDDLLDRILAGACSPRTVDDLARLLTPDVLEADALEFVDELVRNGVLVTELQPLLTGEEAALGLQLTLASLNADGAEILAELRAGLREVDEAGLGCSAHSVPPRETVTLLAEEPPEDLLQVHLTKPVVEAQLARSVCDEVLHGVGAMHRLFGHESLPWVEQFAKAFSERFGDREVPLLEVLDEDIGLGFGSSGESSEPLVAGLAVSGQQAEDRSDPTWAAFTALVCEALHSGAREMELQTADLPEGQRRLPLPDSFAAMVTVIGDPAVEQDEYLLHLKTATGPSGIKLLARFCCDDPELTEHVRRHAAAEERLRPHALFAEIVHAPEGHTGNVLQRPLLRGFEIPILGRSGAHDEATLPLTDLTVSVDSSRRVRLHSLTHAREVEPRLSSAHNYSWNSIPAYRFLCMLQNQGTCAYLGWNWRNLSAAPFLPRVSCGRVVLTPARWRFDSRDVEKLTHQEGAAAFRSLQDVRSERGIPRWIVLVEHENELLVDLENVLSVESFLHQLRGREEQELFEFLGQGVTDFVRGPEGGFAHEIIIPFLRRRRVDAAPAVPRGATTPKVRRVFSPGSEWLYLKVFASGPQQDRLLTESLGPAVRRLVEERIAEEWFFARLGDPRDHLRLRLRGDPKQLMERGLPLLAGALETAFGGRADLRWSLDTYDREFERYGGARFIELSERVFRIDSEAVLEILPLCSSAHTADLRWELGLCGMDQTVDLLGLDLRSRRDFYVGMRDAFLGEHARPDDLRAQMAGRYRLQRRRVEALLEPSGSVDSDDVARGFDVLSARSRRLAEVMEKLQEAETLHQLEASLVSIAASWIHMFLNRLFRSSHRLQEAALYAFLASFYSSKADRDWQEKHSTEGILARG